MNEVYVLMCISGAFISAIYWISTWKTRLEMEQENTRDKVDEELPIIAKTLAEILKSVHQIEKNIVYIKARQGDMDKRISRLESAKK